MRLWEVIAVIVFGGVIAWMLYVAIARHYRNRGWPRLDRRKVNRRRIDRREMQRLEREYGQKRTGARTEKQEELQFNLPADAPARRPMTSTKLWG